MKKLNVAGFSSVKRVSTILLKALVVVLITMSSAGVSAQSTTFATGSFIINMGVTPQTVGNGLKPYGMIYDLVKNYGVPFSWVINPTKIKDGTDFTYNSIDYKGGTFIIPAEYRTAPVNARITYWQNQGVVGVTTNSSLSIPTSWITSIFFAPNWTLDKQNGALTLPYFLNAGIPATAYGGSDQSLWPLTAQLDCCDDLFIMPHADPIWLTHQRLYTWNDECNGGIWLGCHAGSALENMFDNVAPVDANIQTNFLSEKTGPAVGAGPWSDPGNALVLWGAHDSGTLPYSYDYPADPVMQFMGIIDAATQNGSEQIYIPVSAGWRTSTHVGVYDPDHPDRYPGVPPYTGYTDPKHRAAIVAYGPGFGDLANRGKVMLEASHKLSGSTAPANIAAQRAFFNFGFWAAKDKEFSIVFSNLPTSLTPGATYNNIMATVVANYTPQGPLQYEWTSTCGGTFSAPNAATTNFTAPVVSATTPCIIQCKVTDACGRSVIKGEPVTITCNLQVTTTFVNPCFNTPNGGSITMNFTGGTGPYKYTWTRINPLGSQPVPVEGTTITNLPAGTYTVTVRDNNGLGCPATFTLTLSTSPQILPVATPVPVQCNGGMNGAVNLSVSGGSPGFTYLWSNTATSQNISGLTAGIYTVTVTDSKGCTASATATVTQPAVISITPTDVDVSCFGFNDGTINLMVSGGVPGYTYLWSDGATTMNRTGLPPATYSVTVTDANNCTAVASGIAITQPAAAISLSHTQMDVSCNGGTNGSIDLSVTGGTPGYTYLWSNSATTQDISMLTAGAYTVTVTDANDCTAILNVNVLQPTALVVSGIITQPTCPSIPPFAPPSPPSVPPVNSDGAIDITVSGGTPFTFPSAPYNYAWTGPGMFSATTQDITGRPNGTYNVTVTDASGCMAMSTFVLMNTTPNPVSPTTINN